MLVFVIVPLSLGGVLMTDIKIVVFTSSVPEHLEYVGIQDIDQAEKLLSDLVSNGWQIVSSSGSSALYYYTDDSGAFRRDSDVRQYLVPITTVILQK